MNGMNGIGITGVLETALYVADLDRAQRFYEEVFGFRELLRDERMCALSVVDRQVLLLFKKGGSTRGEETPGGFIPPHDGDGRLHLAFAVDAAQLEAWRAHLQANGIEIESEVHPERGSTSLTSLYFRDPDGHCVEVATPNIWSVSDEP